MKTNTQNGFTLLELLITMCIIMILAGIAVPAYKDYKKKAYDVRALSDLKNVSTAEELYYIDEEKYFACKNDSCKGLPSIKNISKGVQISVAAKKDSFTVTAKHDAGGQEYTFDSNTGQIVNKVINK
ncbi:MAG: type IV pilin protein [Bdellovibrionota bacterium]